VDQTGLSVVLGARLRRAARADRCHLHHHRQVLINALLLKALFAHSILFSLNLRICLSAFKN